MRSYKSDLKKRQKPVLKAQNLTQPANRPFSDSIRLNGDFKSYAPLYFMFQSNLKQAEVLFNIDTVIGWNDFNKKLKKHKEFQQQFDLTFSVLRALHMSVKVPLPAV